MFDGHALADWEGAPNVWRVRKGISVGGSANGNTRNKFLARAGNDLIKRLEKPGDWNRYEVRCAGPRIQIFLNGEKLVEYTESDAAIPQNGLIGLQIHGGCKAEISFSNLRIEEISSYDGHAP